MIEWRGGFGDLTIANPAGSRAARCTSTSPNNKLVEKTARDAKSGPVTAGRQLLLRGHRRHLLRRGVPARGQQHRRRRDLRRHRPHRRSKRSRRTFPGVAVSDGTRKPLRAVRRPQGSRPAEASVNPKLEQVVDFGWMSILAKPLFLIVNWFNDAFVHNFGWSIVLVTVVINFILFPLKLSNMKSMRKMQALKPQIDAINAKYKNLEDDAIRKKQEQKQEVMDLYKKNGVNPDGRLRADAAADAVLLRVLQGVHRVAWRCAARPGCG